MSPKKLALYILDQVLSVTAMGVALFWSAGRIDWWAAWAAIAVWVVFFAVTDVLLLHFNPGLIAERLSPPKGAKSWDKTIMSIFRLATLVRYILAGLDQRNGWTVGFPVAAQLTGLVVCVCGYALLAWAMTSNAFFSQIVRIQSEREHTVVTQGPYRYVRHPGCVGMLLFEPAMSTLLGSWWAIIASGVCVILLILRTALEDRALQAELPGYKRYTHQVRYRLLPGVW
jgi:protein-S-isoprenylcysteine O-methyltransferase Ste14